jgi:pyridoxal phosphate enzyme (YggS family)
MSNFVERLAAVRTQIEAACARSHRSPDSVTLIAVSKTQPVEVIHAAAAAGLREFGENRVEEADKIAVIRAQYPNTVWHMIGHVQSRKSAEVIQTYEWIHSLDRLKLANRYAQAAQTGTPRQLLLEINISGEDSKSGFRADRWRNDPDQRELLWSTVRAVSGLPGLQLRGLMTMAPIVADPELTRPVFAGLRGLRDALRADFPGLRWDTLSMGMTDDYPVAIEEGATHIRVGRALFGERLSG